jgi:hypothetical protein
VVSTPLAIPIGTRLGAYEIVALLGAGGMGIHGLSEKVARPQDSKLRAPRLDGASRAEVVGYAIVKLTVTVRIASKPIGAYFHCLTASIADRANASFVDRRTVMSPIVPSA